MQRNVSRETNKNMVLAAVLTALTVAISRVFLIPVPMTHGNINLCDAGIFLAAFMLGSRYGGFVGAASGFLLDLISGYGQYMVFSFIVHGLEGLIAGKIAGVNEIKGTSKVIAMVVGVIIMVAGYFVTDSLLYNVGAGVAGLLTNTIQGIVGAVVAWVVFEVMGKRLSN
ncbi:ECF transporter S component [Lentilactobacillus sp. Marseille-Q4993]|uniref:ECF transporter S component n=1 Tax=Lentilactobacillus sp. Marseille-Q4993 TaxID=3039492 RepID=UPI0024BD0B0E|nr:ECF transporter S component [Lentilactobacillus sp. Marseille-Q4993]